MKDIVIIGAGGLGREVAWLIEDINKNKREWNILGFVDDNMQKGKVVNGYEVLGNIKLIEKAKGIYYTCAIADVRNRKRIVEKLENNLEIKAATLIHPSTYIDYTHTTLGEGCIVCAGSVISVNTKISRFNIVDWNCTIGHDVLCKDFVTLYPGVNISGYCTICECVEIGTGVKIIQKKMIGKNSIVGAGSVIIKDIKENVTVVGVPGKIISSFQ